MLKILRKLLGRQNARSVTGWPLSLPLLNWSRDDAWTIGHAVEGCLIQGSIGSGKTSGSGRAIAESFLRAGFGGMVLTAKKDERQMWEDYATRTGRKNDLVVFGPHEPWCYNFLDAELQHQGSAAGLTENIVNLFSVVLETSDRQGEGGRRDNDGYWKKALKQLMRNAIDTLVVGTGSISVPDLYRLITSAPTTIAEKNNPEWQKTSFCYQCLGKADKAGKTPMQREDLMIAADYFLSEYPRLSDKTRSVILSTFTSMADVLNRGILRQLFCYETNLMPEITHDGKIIVVDLPIHEYREVGLFAQVLLKHAFQMAANRRDVRENPRPIFLWADEAHYFLTSEDQSFQTTCRSARVATVLLSQNISNFYAALGGTPKAQVEANSLFANLNTKIFHANSDSVTNEFASKMIGRSRQLFMNAGQSQNSGEQNIGYLLGMDDPHQSTGGFSEQYEYEVQPTVFTQLRTGGMKCNGLVDAIVFQNGTCFQSTGRTWMPTTFRQNL